jgi:hypothetical protein
MNLSDRALLVSLTISCWNGAVTLDVDEQLHQGLDPERDSIRHQVVPKHELRELQAGARYIRAVHTRATAPWDDNGLRLLPSDQLWDYRKKLKEAQKLYSEVTQDKLSELLGVIEPQYAKYKENLAERFGSRLSIYAVPDTNMPVLGNITDGVIRDYATALITDDTGTRTRESALHIGRLLLTKQQWLAGSKDSTTPAAQKILDQARSLRSIFDTLRPDFAESNQPLEVYLGQI